MNRIGYRKVALFVMFFALFPLLFAYIMERGEVAILKSLAKQDARSLKRQQAEIADLRAKLAVERKARAEASLKAQLERDGVSVSTNEQGESYGLVASVIDVNEKLDLVASHLRKQAVETIGLCNRRQCGFSVSIKDFYKAARLLQEIKPQLQKGLKSNESGRVWIWEKKQP